MTLWIRQLLWHSLWMSFVALAYYVATIRLGKRYAAKWFYLAGIIVLLGFLVPFRPAVTVKMERVPQVFQAAILPQGAEQAAAPQAAQAIGNAPQGFPWQMAFMLWAFGAAMTVFYHGIRHLRFVNTVKRWRAGVQDAQVFVQLEEAKQRLGLSGHDIGIALCACVHSPMLLWLKKPTIILPEGGHAAYDVRLILMHELIHYKRKDLLCRFLMLLAMALHWFNPVLYLLIKLITIECELSCDEKVVENEDIGGRHQYALAILGVARCHARGYTMLTTHFNGGKDTMKKEFI